MSTRTLVLGCRPSLEQEPGALTSSGGRIHVPEPNQHTILYYGEYARTRRKNSRKNEPEEESKAPDKKALRRRWANLIRRVFKTFSSPIASSGTDSVSCDSKLTLDNNKCNIAE